MKYQELPLPAGVKPVPEGYRFVGRPLPEVDMQMSDGCLAINPTDPDDTWEDACWNIEGRLWVAPVADVIPLAKPYTERPLPVGIAPPPDGFVYVGEGINKTMDGLIHKSVFSPLWEIKKGTSGIRP